MRHFVDGFRALATTMRNVFRPAVTVQFPKVLRPRAERYRASFALVHDGQGDEACIGCLQCERICPSQVISIKPAGKRESPVTGKKRGYADDFTLDMNACIYCELCVQVCPEDAIVMTRETETPAFCREELVLTMPKLYANEKSKTLAWATGTKLMGMQEVPKPPKPAVAAPAAVAVPAAVAPVPLPAAPPAPVPPTAEAQPVEPTVAATGTDGPSQNRGTP